MAQENYVEGGSMQRPPLLEPNCFCLWKARFETYIKSKDIDLWQVIQNGDFYFEFQDEETKLMKEMPYELLKDTEKKQLGTNEDAKMTIYKSLPRKDQGVSDEEVDEKEAEAFNLLARNFRKFFHKGNRFGQGNRFGNGGNKSVKGYGNSFVKKVVKGRSQRGLAKIAEYKATSLVCLEIRRRTTHSSEDHRAIMKTAMNL
nr:hypothetical protein [Tanacetum cinerariifolium]